MPQASQILIIVELIWTMLVINLNYLLAYRFFDKVSVESDIDFKLVYVNPEKAIENGLSQRLELTQRNIDLKWTEFNLIETSSENEFRGDVSLSLGVMGNNEYFGDIYDKPYK